MPLVRDLDGQRSGVRGVERQWDAWAVRLGRPQRALSVDQV
jgi:hypothetical protein